ncbi:DUF6075 family protein [Paenibacillus sp. 32O-W]|uniref:DUF6075 family protein n=1 Tax=Paenibacillus sp. 32O-W TaxID=1695218 RepID=UPI0011A1024D|nr:MULTISPECIES: DUF6075 family protein [Paenibacillaceae]
MEALSPKGSRPLGKRAVPFASSRLAFNLWNGWTEEGAERYSAPNELFACGYAPYFFEAIYLRYPEFCRSHDQIFKRRTEQIR